MKKIALILSCIMLFALFGCGRDNAPAADKDTGEITVLTSFFPMYVATINITDGVEGVKVVNMTKPQTGCLHDYQLTTQDMAMIEKADIMVVNGGGMESFLEKAVKQQPKLKLVDASKDIPMLEDNPHLWVSVTNEIKQVQNIAAQLSEIDPKHKEQYEKNCAAYVKKLEKLGQDMHAKLDGFKGRKIITFHEAFPYFAKEFNLEIAAVIDREPGTEPTPKELEDTINIIKGSNIKVIFTEPQYSAGAAKTISAETGAAIYELDPAVTGESNPDAKDAYIKTMSKNAEVLAEALNK
ncbi:MAG: metal ABC transporter substrate-binding protein [Anaerovibrio sp.]|uniref:metal ABC transporter substrate-binding protein n=1 Tax=Anaerovibrio sp. TaxID=1872532 RepID=UPI0025E7D87B|nr:metal ABC transporter substrate-binding protein [Anaerovibrio sp.]MCR5175288.1 metal ABC transporter substrate-binding protein [Anaerovibrio sp.]